ncbi:MAG: hypothetical protein WCJ64_03520 [Rhodospirillaceae bacterium]
MIENTARKIVTMAQKLTLQAAIDAHYSEIAHLLASRWTLKELAAAITGAGRRLTGGNLATMYQRSREKVAAGKVVPIPCTLPQDTTKPDEPTVNISDDAEARLNMAIKLLTEFRSMVRPSNRSNATL